MTKVPINKQAPPPALYDIMVKVSKKFLNFQKSKFPKVIFEKTQKLMDQFSSDYENKDTSKLKISGLSCRARIYLLMRIMEEKRKRLPKNFDSITKENFKSLCKNKDNFEQEYWDPVLNKSQTISHWQIQDKKPTIFLVDDQSYTLELLYTHNQPGNGKITMGSDSFALSHISICSKIDNTKIPVKDIFQSIWAQKKDGKSIKTGSSDNEKLLNGYSFLLDFEIARRKVHGDAYEDLPLITCFPFLMKNLPSTYDTLSKAHNEIFSQLLTGTKRHEAVKNLIEKHKPIIPTTVKEMRELLKDFHQLDELSSLESQSQSDFPK